MSDRYINRRSVNSAHGSPPLLCPVLGATALPLSMLIILSQPPPLLVPLLLVLFLLLVFIVVNLAILSGNAMTINRPSSPNSSQVHPPVTSAADLLPIPN